MIRRLDKCNVTAVHSSSVTKVSRLVKGLMVDLNNLFCLSEKNNANDLFIWKFNTIFNQNSTSVNLLEHLEQGRYLLETRSSSSDHDWIYVWVLSDNMSVQTRQLDCQILQRLNLVNIRIVDPSTKRFTKKLMYAFEAKSRGKSEAQTDLNGNKMEFKQLKNDLNLSSLTVSSENLEFLLGQLLAATENLCESLKRTPNGYSFALI